MSDDQEGTGVLRATLANSIFQQGSSLLCFGDFPNIPWFQGQGENNLEFYILSRISHLDFYLQSGH